LGVHGEPITLLGLPAATSRCRLERALAVEARDYLLNQQGQQVMPIAGNAFIVATFGLQFKNATSTLSSKDFYLDSGKARFECIGFNMMVGAGKPPVFVGGTDEATLSIGGEENFANTKGNTSLTLVFAGPRDYAKGTISVKSNYPVRVSKPKAKVSPTSTPKGAKKSRDKKK
jgi:hypothetical protein